MPTETVAIKIASLVLEDEPRAYEAPSLYVHATAPVVPVKTYEDALPGAWALNGSGTFDFTTFMNGLSVMKWRRYTLAWAGAGAVSARERGRKKCAAPTPLSCGRYLTRTSSAVPSMRSAYRAGARMVRARLGTTL